jgi:hypothetical protein
VVIMDFTIHSPSINLPMAIYVGQTSESSR